MPLSATLKEGGSAFGSTCCLFGQTAAAVVVVGDEMEHNFFSFFLFSVLHHACKKETTKGVITARNPPLVYNTAVSYVCRR